MPVIKMDDYSTRFLLARLLRFRRDRDWVKFHTTENLIKSINIESAELMELYQWGLPDQENLYEKAPDEIADIFIYLLYLAHDLDIDIIEACHNKIDKNEKKYPVDICKGRSTKYDQL